MITRRTLLAAGLATPAFAPSLARAEADQRPVLRVAVQALPPTLEPLDTISNVGMRLTYNVFDTLWRRDFAAEAREGGSRLTPFLATSLEQRDPNSWVAELRRGVRMHDGSELSAEDVLATFSAERMFGERVQHPWGRITFGHLAGVETEDSHRVVFRTKAPDVVMPHRLASYGGWIHSARFHRSEGLAGMRARPAGSGPYRVVSFQNDRGAVLEAFDEYWQGRPPARQIVFTAVPESSTRLAALQAGDFDLVTNLLPEQAQALARSSAVEAASVELDLAHILFYDTRRPVLADARVRKALNHAVDYDMLGQSLWGPDFRRMAALQLASYGPFYEGERRGFAYDPDRARQLLRAAGYRGEEVVIRIAPGYYLQMAQAVQIIQAMWQAVGIVSRLETRENAVLVNEPGADVRPTSISLRFPDPLGGGLAVHMANDYFIQTDGFWRPTTFNEILAAFRAATDPAERRRLWSRLLDEFEAEAPAMILYQVREFFAKRRAIRWSHPTLYYMDFRASNLAFS